MFSIQSLVLALLPRFFEGSNNLLGFSKNRVGDRIELGLFR